MKKILIVVPNRTTEEELAQQNNRRFAWFFRLIAQLTRMKPWVTPGSAMVLAAFTKKVFKKSDSDVYIVIWDEFVRGEISDEVMKNGLFDLCIVTYLTPSRFGAFRVADLAKKYGVLVVAGGIDVSGLNREKRLTKLREHFDTLFLGHVTTNSWQKLLEDFKSGNLQKTYQAARGEEYEFIFPAYDLVNLKDYFLVGLQSSVGCPYDCDFCAVSIIAGPRTIYKSIALLRQELTYLKSHGIKIFLDFSDCFGANKRFYLEEVLPLYREFGLLWVTELSIPILVGPDGKSGLIQAMKESGCAGAYIGVESLDVPMPKNPPWLVKRAIERCQELKMLVLTSFIVDLDPDLTFDRLKKNVHLLLDWGVRLFQFSLIALVPGTKQTQKAEQDGDVASVDPRDFDGSKPTKKHPKIPQITLVEYLRWCLKEVYRTKYLLPFVWWVLRFQRPIFWLVCRASIHIIRSMIGWRWTHTTNS